MPLPVMLTISRFLELSRCFVIDLCGRSLYPDSPIAITEIVSIPPGGVETYHLPLALGTLLNIEINAAAPLQIRFLDEVTWQTMRTLDARLNVYSHFDVCGRAAQIQVVVPNSGGYMLLLFNSAATTNNVLVALNSDVSVPPRSAGESTNSTSAPFPAFAALARLFSFRD